MISVLLVLIFLIGIISVIINGLRVIDRTEDLSVITNFAKTKLEEIRGESFSSVADDSGNIPSSLKLFSATYSTDVNNIDMDGDGTVDTDAKSVDLTVTWSERMEGGLRARTETVSTIVIDGGLNP